MGPRHRLRSPTPALALVLILIASTFGAARVAAAGQPSGYTLLTGPAAADFRLPNDVRPVRSWRDQRSGLTFERYQQFARPLGVYVDGAQLTVVRRADRQAVVIGAHHPGLRVDLRPALGPAQAIGRAAADDRLPSVATQVAALVNRRAELRLDPETGRQFYLVESGAPGIHRFHRVDAESGAVTDAWEAIDRVDGMGTGVKADRKSLRGADGASTADDLTSRSGTTWRMVSKDGRILTYDAKGGDAYGTWAGLKPMTDSAKSAWLNDNDWAAKYQRPAVDAQYYAALTDEFLRTELGFDIVADCDYGAIRNVVHFDPWPGDGFGYDNAFWDGFEEYMVYGDGDGYFTRAFSAGQDVVTHELSHAVTQCRVDLVYRDEPGALNEAFSDIMAVAAEWQFEEPIGSNCRLDDGQSRCADWWLGEDVIIGGGSFGFRNFLDPATEGQPSHYSGRRYIGKDYDNGGVHVNSGIVNHAFYLMVNGGRNARCSGSTDSQADCDVFVPPIPIDDATQVVFLAWGLLTEQSNMCAARNASVAAADLLFPGSAAHHAAADLAWAAVGRDAEACQPPAPFSTRLSSRSVALAPGGDGELGIDLSRGSGHSAPVSYSVSDVAPATAVASIVGTPPDDEGRVVFDAPPDAPSAIYPLVVSATDGATTFHASAVLILDGDAPQVSVDGIRFVPSATVSATGAVPLAVAWQAVDETSGVVAAHLEHSTDGAGWSPSTTPFSAGAGAHHLRAAAVDGLGNSATSDVLSRTLTGFQETAATFKGGWSTFSAGSPWGTTRYSKIAGASAKFTFTGSDVVWVAQRGPKRGKARVYLDGKLTRVDLYAASLSERRVVFSAANLAAGPHTLRIVVRGTTGRPRVDVDGFFVLTP